MISRIFVMAFEPGRDKWGLAPLLRTGKSVYEWTQMFLWMNYRRHVYYGLTRERRWGRKYTVT